MKGIVLAALAAVFVAGCASTGVRVTDDQLQQFTRGQTTRAEVTAALGAPTTVIRNSDGTVTASYVYSEARTRASTFIPIVGAFVGGVDSHSDVAMLTFDKRGILKDTSSSASQFGTATGIAVDGGSAVEDQPRK